MIAYAVLVVYLAWLVAAFGLRSLVQMRRTGDGGWRSPGGRPGSIQWWSRIAVGFGAVAAGLAAPIADLAGLPAIGVLDRSPLRVAGLGLAVFAAAATIAAQIAMGASWRNAPALGGALWPVPPARAPGCWASTPAFRHRAPANRPNWATDRDLGLGGHPAHPSSPRSVDDGRDGCFIEREKLAHHQADADVEQHARQRLAAGPRREQCSERARCPGAVF